MDLQDQTRRRVDQARRRVGHPSRVTVDRAAVAAAGQPGLPDRLRARLTSQVNSPRSAYGQRTRATTSFVNSSALDFADSAGFPLSASTKTETTCCPTVAWVNAPID